MSDAASNLTTLLDHRVGNGEAAVAQPTGGSRSNALKVMFVRNSGAPLLE